MIVAAGRGVRFGGPIPKPVTTLAGKAVVAMSVEAMAAGIGTAISAARARLTIASR